MTRYVTNEDGTYGPSRRSGHDDTVISLGIGWMTVVTEGQSLDYTAMAAAGPAYIPGATPPKMANYGSTVSPNRPNRWAMPETDETIGIESYY
jgi:hypothetical protein